MSDPRQGNIIILPVSPPDATSEARRLAILREYGVLESEPEEAFDEITRLAMQICKAQIGLIIFFGSESPMTKSCLGMDPVHLPSDNNSIFAKTAFNSRFSAFENISNHPEFVGDFLTGGAPKIQFCASVSLMGRWLAREANQEEAPIGVLCVMDVTARTLGTEQRAALETLGRQVMTQLELRRAKNESQKQVDRGQAALRDSEAFYHSLVESLPQNIFRKDLRGIFTFANSRFCATVGKPRDAVIGKTDFDLFPSELAKKYQGDDQRVLTTRETFETIERNQLPGGGVMHVHVIKTPLYDSKGMVVGVQGIFWDETDAVKAREALAYERELLRAMLQNIPDCIYFKDRESRFLACSQSLAHKLGVSSPDQVLGKTDFDFFDAKHAQEAFLDEQNILLTGQPMIAKSEFEISNDGTEAWVLSTKVPLTSPTGQIIGTFGISKDITKLKATEAELAVARDQALESARLKSEFLANMSHEIRTPMNAIIGMTGLLLDMSLPAQQRDFAITIRDSAEALLNIINDILDFSKIEAGKLEIEPVDFELREVVEGTVEMLAESAQAKQIEFISWIHPEVPHYIRADPGRIRQVLINLIGNGVKFTEQGEVVISVTQTKISPNQVTLRFEICDTGIGIPYKAQSKIFGAFTQADGSTTRKYGGTGLGLAITRQLVELMRGRIDFNSKPGVGSLFWFELPVEKSYLPAPAVADPRSHLQSLRVLIVDDNATNRKILQHQLESWQIRNSAAESGEQALSYLKNAIAEGDPYELAILDMQMPFMDGLTLARNIKSEKLLKETGLIMLTSLGYGAKEAGWQEAGIAAYLVKPVKQSRLFDVLAGVISSREFATKPLPAPKSVDRAKSTPNRANLRILLAEDNVVNQKVALKQLQKLGYQAEAVANGLEVLNAVGRITYHVILMDCQMPEMDGYETAQTLTTNPSFITNFGENRPYIIAMTANALAGDREKCLSFGMDDYISKPVRIDQLEAALERAGAYLQGRRDSRDGKIPPAPE